MRLCNCISMNIVMSVCADIKKIKRRLYQQKRRQSQGKEPAGGGGTPKKQRVRKVSVSIAVSRFFIFLAYLFVCYFGLSVSGLTVMSARRDLVIENIRDSDTRYLVRNLQQIARCVCSIFGACGRSYVGRMCRLRAVPLEEHCCNRVMKQVIRLEV